MTIRIIQTCDGCGVERDLDLHKPTTQGELRQAEELGGWRRVLDNKHLCAKCIRKAVNN